MKPGLALDPLSAARAALNAGAALEARRLLEAMLAAARARPIAHEAEAYVELGNALEQSGDYSIALARFVRGYELASARGNAALQARALVGMAKVDHAMGDLELATMRLDEGAALIAAVREPSLAGDLFHLLGMTHSQLGQEEGAEVCFRLAIQRKRGCGDEHAVANALNSLGDIFLRRGNREPEGAPSALPHYQAARRHFDQALAAARACGDAHLEVLALGNVGIAAGSLGDLPLALDLFGQQLVALRARGDRERESLVLTNIGEAHRRAGDYEAALGPLHDALVIALDIDSPPRARAAHGELSRVHESAGDYAAALAHFKAFHDLDRRIRSVEAEKNAVLVGARLAVDEIRSEADAYRVERSRLRDANEVLAVQAFTDPLTGLANRRSFDRMVARAFRHGPYQGALAIIDLDHFKQVNDSHSHLVGDRVLQRVGALLRTMLRPSDSAFRFGGEEFCILMPATLADAAQAICERLRLAIEAEGWAAMSDGLAVTASFGVAAARADDNAESLALRADTALYEAKDAGRNRVVRAAG